MSDYGVVGEASVRIRPEVSGFESEAKRQIDEAVKNAERQAADTVGTGAADSAKKSINDVYARIQELQIRAETAAMQAKPLEAWQFNAQAQILQVTEAAAHAREMAKAETGAMQELLLTSADSYVKAAKMLEGQLASSRASGRIPGEPGLGGQILQAFGGRTGGLPGLVAMGARLGAVGFAVTAAIQLQQRLATAIKVTGDEAYTTEGRVRNLAGSLLSADLVGAVEALTRDRPAKLSSGLAAALAEIKQKSDALYLSEERLLDARRRGDGALKEYLVKLDTINAVSSGTAENLFKVTNNLYEQERAAKVAASAMQDVADAIARAGSEAAAYGERSGDFGRGPGAIAAEQAVPGAGAYPSYDSTATTSTAAAIAASLASRTEGLEDDLALARKEVERIRERNENMKEIVEGRAKRYQELVEAVTRVKVLEGQIADQQAAADAAAKDAAEAARKARQAALDEARERLRAATELGLENELAKAQLSGKKSLIRRALEEILDYWKGLYAAAVKAGDALARERAQAAVIATKQRIKDLTQKKPEEEQDLSRQIKETALANQVAAAALTKRKSDDIKFLNLQLDYYVSYRKELLAKGDQASKLAAEQVRGTIIGIRRSLQSALESETGKNAAPARDFFKEAVQNFIAFGNNFTIPGRDGGVLSPQDARGQFASLFLSQPAIDPRKLSGIGAGGYTSPTGEVRPIVTATEKAAAAQAQRDAAIIKELRTTNAILAGIGQGRPVSAEEASARSRWARFKVEAEFDG